MAAATRNGVAAGNQDGGKLIHDYLRAVNLQNAPHGLPVLIGWKEAVLTTDIDDIDDILRLSPLFGPDTVLHSFYGTPSDLDGATGLVYDIVWITAAGVVTLTLVSGSTKGQAASGTDPIADAARFRHVGAGYLAMKVTTAATTPAAGTYDYGLVVSRGWLKPQTTGVFLGNARA